MKKQLIFDPHWLAIVSSQTNGLVFGLWEEPQVLGEKTLHYELLCGVSLFTAAHQRQRSETSKHLLWVEAAEGHVTGLSCCCRRRRWRKCGRYWGGWAVDNDKAQWCCPGGPVCQLPPRTKSPPHTRLHWSLPAAWPLTRPCGPWKFLADLSISSSSCSGFKLVNAPTEDLLSRGFNWWSSTFI